MRADKGVTSVALHPAFIAGLAALILNDHIFKPTFATWWTGKLSDAAWLIVFPLFIVGAYEKLTKRRATSVMFVYATASAVAALVAINVVPLAGDAYQVGLAALQWPFKGALALISSDAVPPVGTVRLARDASDLLMTPFAVVPILIGLRLGQTTINDLR